MARIRFTISGAFLPVGELIPLAIAADELGYDSLSLADHVVDIETLQTPYPYTDGGQRRWELGTDWPDPWVAIGALSAVTTRLTFLTTVYVPAMRNPYVVAKAVSTAAVMSGNRVRLGVGVGWCREEFELLETDFATRGARTDEGLDLMRELWTQPLVERDGPFYPAPPLMMHPQPTAPIPILVGGLSDVALRRAARFDGWVGDIYSTEEAAGFAARLRAMRPADAPAPQVSVALNDAFLPEHFLRAAELGITDAMAQPWVFYTGMRSTLEQKIDGMKRFKDDVLDVLDEVG